MSFCLYFAFLLFCFIARVIKGESLKFIARKDDFFYCLKQTNSYCQTVSLHQFSFVFAVLREIAKAF